MLLILQLAVVAVLQCNANFAYFAAVFEATSFNFLFTTPRYSLQMFNLEDILNLTVFLLVALTTSKLAELYRRQQAYGSNIVVGITHLDQQDDQMLKIYRDWMSIHGRRYPLFGNRCAAKR